MADEMAYYLKIYERLEKTEIKGLGEKTVKKLNELGIERVCDLLYYFPRTFEDRTNLKKIKQLIPEEYAVVEGTVLRTELLKARGNMTVFKAVISDDTGLFELVWFNMPFLKKSITNGAVLRVTGKIKSEYGLKMVNPEYRFVRENEIHSGRITSVYSLPSTLNQSALRKIIEDAYERYSKFLFEILPANILNKYKLPERREAARMLHFPRNPGEVEEAKRRFAVEELMILEIGIISRRFQAEMANKEKYILEDNKNLVKMFLANLGFELTKAQKRVITEIYKDLNNGKIVNRLIQGDVGSGKTIVAVIMLLYMVENGYQGVFMAPTEILAEQHYIGIVDKMNELGVKVEVLSSSVKGRQKEHLLGRIKGGDVDIVVGTHAVIEENVEFHKLGLIVIDEQHRFGVMQRKKLRDKGILANLVVMSATPIPRSLALSIYGDLDVSIIDHLPPGRKPIKTKWIKSGYELEKVYTFIKNKVSEGRQCYIVCPLIEESEKIDVTSVSQLFEELLTEFGEIPMDMLHGKIENKDREEIMRNFKKNRVKILVATTVIEVGVNVPNASIMVIMDAQRFGLSQLHQLRGRVGRGEHESYCFLYADTDNEVSKARLKIMERTTDGFEIAEEDLKLRKSGEIFGTRQSGIGDLKFSDIVNDVKTIKLARDEAMEYLVSTNGKIENPYLKREIEMKLDREWVNN